jgi:hypothetical protein
MKDKLDLIVGRQVVARIPVGSFGARICTIGDLTGGKNFMVTPKLGGCIFEFPAEAVSKIEVINELPVITLQ